MALSLIRHNIQGKEKTFVFFDGKCCTIKAYHTQECDCLNCSIIPGTESWIEIDSDGHQSLGMRDGGCVYQPNRCSKHNTELKAWQRKRKYIKKWMKLFEKYYIRWRYVKMLTLTMPGYMHIKPRIGEDVEDYMIYFRNEIVRRFKLLRKRSKYWNKVIDGGQWFYECPLKNGKTNPHLHILLVGPKKVNQDLLKIELKKYHLGEIMKFSSPKNKDGVIQKMTYWKNRKLMMNKSAVSRVMNYVMKYVTKEEHADGKNNAFFGNLHGKKKRG
jgi:hypothetical protein